MISDQPNALQDQGTLVVTLGPIATRTKSQIALVVSLGTLERLTSRDRIGAKEAVRVFAISQGPIEPSGGSTNAV